MSTLYTNEIYDTEGDLILKNTGSIIQYVSYYAGPAPVQTSTSSSGAWDSTFITTSITPKRANSKLLVTSCFNMHYTSGSGDDGAAVKIYRDGSPINSANSGDQLFYRADANGNLGFSPTSICHFVNSNNTNSTTFQVYMRNVWGGSATISTTYGTATLTIMEIS